MATLDLNARIQAELVHAGINAAVCHISLSASGSVSVGDVHRIGKLPNGAIPLDSVFYPGTASPAGFVAKFGTSASQEMFFASATYSVMARCIRRLGTNQQISISDDARVLYENITMVATVGVSIGFIGDLVVFYKIPGQTL